MMQVHPSVIMSISEHHTRVRANRVELDRVIGALLGKKTDHKIEIVDSFELCYIIEPTTNAAGQEVLTYVLDKEFYIKKIPLVKQVSADLELVGWYSTVNPPTQSTSPANTISENLIAAAAATKDEDVALHQQISEFIPNPILLKLNPYKRESDPKISSSLPLNIYEPVIAVESGGEKLNFIEVSWTIVTEDIEILALEHNAKMTHVNVAPSAAIDNLRLQYSAVKMLKDRIKVISKFVKDVQSGALQYYEEPLADIAKLSHRFPIINSEQYSEAYNVQCNDVALNTYLGILTKGSMCKLYSGAPTLKLRAFSSTHARR